MTSHFLQVAQKIIFLLASLANTVHPIVIENFVLDVVEHQGTIQRAASYQVFLMDLTKKSNIPLQGTGSLLAFTVTMIMAQSEINKNPNEYFNKIFMLYRDRRWRVQSCQYVKG